MNNSTLTVKWWPQALGDPSTSGFTDGLRYAYFPSQQQLVIEHDGKIDVYALENYHFRGVIKPDGPNGELSFLSQKGRVALQDLCLIK